MVGATVLGGSTLGVASSTTLTVIPIAGSIPTTYWVCFAIAWENSLGGLTKINTPKCVQASLGGLRVSMPGVWPIPFPKGKTLGRLYQAMFPGKPSSTINNSMYNVDYLYTPTDTFDLTTVTEEEYDSPVSANSSGLWMDPWQTFEQNIGMGTFQPGELAVVSQPAGANPDNGWWYTIYGIGCQISTDGCRGCNRHRGVQVTLPNPLPSVWRTDRIPFGVNGTCFQRLGPSNVGTVFHKSGYNGGCTWRYQEWYDTPDGTTQIRDTLGLCDGELRWFGKNVNDIIRRCNATGCQ